MSEKLVKFEVVIERGKEKVNAFYFDNSVTAKEFEWAYNVRHPMAQPIMLNTTARYNGAFPLD